MIAHWREWEQGGEGWGWRGQQIERERESWDDGGEEEEGDEWAAQAELMRYLSPSRIFGGGGWLQACTGR